MAHSYSYIKEDLQVLINKINTAKTYGELCSVLNSINTEAQRYYDEVFCDSYDEDNPNENKKLEE